MGTQTNIEWATHSWNPWIGCSPVQVSPGEVSPACQQCYAAREMRKYGKNPDLVQRTSAATWRNPLTWNKQAAASGQPAFVFSCSWGDFFHPDADAWRAEAWAVIKATPHLTWLILTKRTELIAPRLPADWGPGWPHVLLGATVEHPDYDRRIIDLVSVEAAGYFLSLEPLLGPVDPLRWLTVPDDAAFPQTLYDEYALKRRKLRAVFAGGETGPKARPTHPSHVRTVRDACRNAGIPFMWKSWGEWLPSVYFNADQIAWAQTDAATRKTPHGPKWHVFPGGFSMIRCGRQLSGRLLDGVEHLGMPQIDGIVRRTVELEEDSAE